MRGRREPGRADVRGGEADHVVPGIVRGEGEPTSGWASRVDQRSIVVCFLHEAAIESKKDLFRFGMLVTKEENES